MTDSDHGFSHSPDTLWNDLRQWLPNGFKNYTHLPTSSTSYQLSKRKLHFIICSSKWTKFMLNFKSMYIWLLRDMRDVVEPSKQDDSVTEFWNAWEPLVWVQFKQRRIFSIGTIDILGHDSLMWGASLRIVGCLVVSLALALNFVAPLSPTRVVTKTSL